ncbi:MAG: hypothetical protein J6U00_04165 [Ruminococcus sp.]|uniref:hypothetical protein n=1 Tax=Ruminococcus sp. TaxID=41978 RepID=UPI001B0E16DE|nr:hypothetical protein [Ruminococcus sp.]MBO7473186.1 hypothetical protein [Ruminococcus sp.]
MQNLILACVGLAIAIAGGVYLARLLYFKKFGVAVKAEVLDAEEVLKRRGVAMFGSIMRVAKRVSHYTHTMRYDFGGKIYKVKDKAGYTEPMKVGSTRIILCDPKKPESFKLEDDVQRHITITAALAVMALFFAGRFFYEYIK